MTDPVGQRHRFNLVVGSKYMSTLVHLLDFDRI